MGLATVERVKYPHIRAAERDRQADALRLQSDEFEKFLAKNTIYSIYDTMPEFLPLWLRRQLKAAIDGDNHGIHHEMSDDSNLFHTMAIRFSKSNTQERNAAKKRRDKKDQSFWDMLRAYMESFETTLKSIMDLSARIKTVERKIDLKIAALGPAAAMAGGLFDEIKTTVTAIKQELTSTADNMINGGRLPSVDTLKAISTKLEASTVDVEAAAEAAETRRSIFDSVKAWRQRGNAKPLNEPVEALNAQPLWQRAFETAAEATAAAFYAARGRSSFNYGPSSMDFAYSDESYRYTADDEKPKNAKSSAQNTKGQKAKPGAEGAGTNASGENSYTPPPQGESEQAANTAGPAPGEETL